MVASLLDRLVVCDSFNRTQKRAHTSAI